jgi:hypothetical protein
MSDARVGVLTLVLSGAFEHALSTIKAPKMQLKPTIAIWPRRLFTEISTFIFSMYLIFLEALAAGLILIGIVWWTMFTGRPKPQQNDQEQEKIQQEN